MKTLLNAFTRQLTTDSFDHGLAQWFCWVSALGFLIICLRKVAVMELTEAQLILGVLLSVATAVLFTLTGLVFQLAETLRKLTSQSCK